MLLFRVGITVAIEEDEILPANVTRYRCISLQIIVASATNDQASSGSTEDHLRLAIDGVQGDQGKMLQTHIQQCCTSRCS